MAPVPGAAPAPTDPIGRLKEHPKSKLRQEKVVAAIRAGDAQVRELAPLVRDRDKDLVRAALLIAASVEESDPGLEAQLLEQIGGRDKPVAIAAVRHLSGLGTGDRRAALTALGETDLSRYVVELFDVARPRDLKEALNGDDALRARVAVAEVIRRGDKGEALLYEARSQKDGVVSGAALVTLRSMFVAGSLKPRARIDSFWLWRARLRG